MKLRDYETRAIKALPGLLNLHKRVVAVAPTGSGKTVISAALIRKMTGARVLWLAHRKELLEQAVRQLVAAGIPESWIGLLTSAKRRNAKKARILVASVGMFRSREVPEVDIIVVDEAHRTLAKSYVSILSARPDAFVLGLTATPWRLDGKGLGDVFKHLHVMATPTELIADGHIVQPRTYGIPKSKAKEILGGVPVQAGDYQTKALGKAMMKRSLMGDVVVECARLAPDAPTLVFAVNREHGRALAARFSAAGSKVAYLDGETPTPEREAIIAALVDGTVQVIVNVDVLTEGFDCPPVKCVALCRPTKSLTRFLQPIGRASRPFGTGRPVVLDHAGNCWRHGLPETDRVWTLDGRERGDGSEAPVKQCPECEAMIPISATECPECGAAQSRDAGEIAEEQAELERLAATQKEKKETRALLEKLAKDRGAPRGWVESTLAKMFEAA